MEFRTLPHIGVRVSRACFGTMTFGSQVNQADAARVVDTCIDAGINFFDTANVYNQGESERIVGNVLKNRRQSVVLASKVRGKMGDAPDQAGLSRAAIFRAIDESLKRLQTDYLDFYYLHLPDYTVPIEESLDALNELVKAGKILYPATSNYSGWQVVQMFCISGAKGYTPPYLSQPMYNLLARGIEQEYLPMCREFGVSTVVYNPLAGGLLTGKQQRERPQPGTRFDSNQMYLDRYWHPQYFDAVERLRQIAADAGRSMVELALSWLLHHTSTDSIILGASSLEQLQQNLAAFESGPLTEDTLTACDSVWQDLRGVTPKYNR